MDATHAPGAAVRIGLLGSFTLELDGATVDVSRPQVRAILSRLALDAGRVVTSDQLIDVLWPTDMPADPRAALRVVLSRVRATLGAHVDALASPSTGYQLDAVTDVVEFHDAIDAASAAAESSEEHLQALGTARGLWRGSPLPELVEVETGRSLDHLIDGALGAAAELGREHLKRGGARDALLAVAELAALHPEHEMLGTVLARSQAALGSQTAALASIERCHAARRDAGLARSNQLAELELAILRGAIDQTSERAAATPDATPFVGRKSEIRTLVHAAARTTVVLGEPGIGKSALLGAAITQLTRDRNVVHLEVDRHPPRPLDLARQIAQAFAEHAPRDLHPDQRAQLDWLAYDAAPEAPSSRDVMIEALVSAVVSNGPDIVLVIDDVQWADRTSMAAVERIAAAAASPLVLGSRPSLEPAMERIVGLDATHVIELGPLTAAESADLLDRLGVRRDGIGESIAERAGGNPLLTSLLAELAVEGSLDADPAPTSVVTVVRQRVDDFSASERDALDLAAVLGEHFDITALDVLHPGSTSMRRAATRAGLFTISESTEAQFRHPVVRDALMALIPAGRVAELHDEIAAVLGGDVLGPARYAHHCLGAAEIDPTRAGNAQATAAGWFARGRDWGLALQHADAGLGFRSTATEEDTIILMLARGQAMRALGLPGSGASLREAAERALDRDDIDVASRALEELCRHGDESRAGEVDSSLMALVRKVLERPDITERRWVRLAAAVPTLVAVSSQAPEARDLYLRALDLASTIDEELEVEVMMLADFGLSHPDDFDRRIAVRDRMNALASDDLRLQWEAAFLSFGIAVVEGDRAGLDGSWSRLQSIGVDVPDRQRDFGMAFLAASYAIVIGDDVDRAKTLADDAETIGYRSLDPTWVFNVYSSLYTAIRRLRGELGALLELLDSMIEQAPDFVTWRAVAARAALASGDRERARIELDRALSHGLIRDASWTAVAVLVAETVAEIGPDDTRRQLYDELLPHSGRMSWTGVTTIGPIDDALAALATSLQRDEDAAHHLRRAAEVERRLRPLGGSLVP